VPETLLERLSGVAAQAGEVELSLRPVVGWASWRLLGRGAALVAGLAGLLWLAHLSAWWWNERALRFAQAEKAVLQAEIAGLEANRPGPWQGYDAALRQRGSLTIWFTDEAVAAWKAEPRTIPGGQPWYSPLAILTALTLRAVFRLAMRQTEGLIGSIIHLLGLALAVPDHTTLCRRAKTLEVPRPRPRNDSEPMHLLVDSTGLKLCGAGEWLLEKHGTKTRRAWRKLHIGLDAETGQIVAAALTPKEVDDGAEVGPLLDQVLGPVASFTGDGAYDQEGVSTAVAERHREAAIIVPPRSTAVPSETAESAPTQRDRHLQFIAEHGRAAWQKASGYTTRARAEATIGRFKEVIGDGLRSRTDERRATEVDVAVHALNRMLELGRPISVRIALTEAGLGLLRPFRRSAQHGHRW